MNKVRISVVMICAANENVDICIKQVLKQLNVNDQFTLICDNTPEPILNKVKLISDKRFSFFLSKNHGNRSANRNIGFEYSVNPFVLFIDGDIFLHDECINMFRENWQNNPELCICGNVHGMQYEYEQLSFILQDMDIKSKYLTNEGRECLMNNVSLTDFRYRLADSIKLHKLCWLYFYSAYCGIPAKLFIDAGKFDENLSGWGAEDIDLGYRLSQITNILYDKRMIALHFPHPRNIFVCRDTNILNIYRLFIKYKTAEFEYHCAFHASYASIPCMRDILNVMREKNNNTPKINNVQSGELYILCASKSLPYGRIIYNLNNNTEVYNLSGTAIPSYDKQFKVAYLTSDIFAYPHLVYARIIAEAVRVSENTYISICDNVPQINWHEYKIDLHLLSKSKFNFYTPVSIEDFSFKKISENLYAVNYQLTDHIPIFSYTIFDDAKKFLKSTLTAIREIYFDNNEIIFINLSTLETWQCPLKAMSKLFCFKPVMNYRFVPHDQNYKILETVYEELYKYAFNFVFFVDELTNIVDAEYWSSLRPNNHDMFVDRSGNTMII